MAIDQPSPEYTAAQPDWMLLRDCHAGERAMKNGGTRYVPKISTHEPSDYLAYVQRGSFLNPVAPLIKQFLGLAMRKAPTVEAPESMLGWLKRIDGGSRSLNDQVSLATAEKLLTGRAAVFLDLPDIDHGEEMSQAEIEEIGAIPSISIIPAENIIDWHEEGGRLTHVRLSEEHSEFDRERFETTNQEQIRVLEIDPATGFYVQRVHRKTTADFDSVIEVYPQIDGEYLTEIPFWFIGDTSSVEKSPLLDIAFLAKTAFQHSCDLNHGLHYVGLPTPVITGVDPDDKDLPNSIGPTQIWRFSDRETKAFFLQVDAAGFAALEARLEALKREIATNGLSLTQQATGQAESGVSRSIRVVQENAVLADAVYQVESAFRSAIKLAAKAFGEDPKEIGLTLNRDFVGQRMSPEEVKALLAAYQAGTMSLDTVLNNFRQGEIIAADVSNDDEVEKIEEPNLDRAA